MMAIRENPQDAREVSVLDRTSPASASYDSWPAFIFNTFSERVPCNLRPIFVHAANLRIVDTPFAVDLYALDIVECITHL